MILVILGAGASFDAVPSQWGGGRQSPLHRLPLATELFEDIEPHEEAFRRFPRFHALVPYLRNIASNNSIEQELEKYQTESKSDPERVRQLAAIRYYLQFIISQSESIWMNQVSGITNHKTLIDELRRAKGPDEPVCIVTFNYDCLVEHALDAIGLRITKMSDYIDRPDYKLFKLHGSTNWGREIYTRIDKCESRSHEDLVKEFIARADELEITDNFRLSNGYPIGRSEESPIFPAIAIPVQTKEHFECPHQHLETLKSLLPRTSKLLIIGWRGLEDHFLSILLELLPKKVETFIVNGTEEAAESTKQYLMRSGIILNATLAPSGFTHFILTRLGNRFFERS